VVALRTSKFNFLLVVRRISGEKVDSQQLVCLSFLFGKSFKSLQFDKSPAALSIAAVEKRSDRHKRVNIFGLKLFFVLNKTHRSLHGSVVVFLVQLSLAEQVKVDTFCSFPWIGECLVCR